jgi:hypothetical protein
VLYPLSLWRNRWLPFEFSALPNEQTDDPQRRDYLLVARSLAQLLARCTPRGASREFGAALRAYRAIRGQLRAGRKLQLPAHLLSDMSHEIALYAERAALDAALRCLRRAAAPRLVLLGAQ